MPTTGPDLSRLSLSQLRALTGAGERTIRKRLEGLEPVAEDGRTRWYAPQPALERIFGVGAGLDITAERARLASEQADRIAMDNAESRGEAARWDDVESFLVPLLSSTVQRLRAVPAKAAPEAHGAASIEETEAEIRKVQDDALSDVVRVLAGGPPALRRRVGAEAAERRRRDRQRPAPSIESSEGGERHAD